MTIPRRGGATAAPSTQRAANRALVVELLGRSAPLSRAEVAARVGLSRGTVSSIVNELLADGVVEETRDALPGRTGRPPTLLALSGTHSVLVGVDIGHRHVRVVISDPAGDVLVERLGTADVDHSSEQTLDLAATMVRDCLDECSVEAGNQRVVGVGMGVPGPVDPQTGLVASPILPGWRGLTPAAELARRIGHAVRTDNDANLGAVGEVRYGVARGHSEVIYVKAASGIGAGLVLAGRLHRGASGIAGEIGHVRLRDDGPVCRCGNRGCLETAVAAPKLLELLTPMYPDVRTVPRMVELSNAGDVGIARMLGDAGRSVGRVLADLSNHLNPDMIVIGGDMGPSASFLDGIRDSVDRYAQPDTAAALTVVPGSLGARAEVMGALAIAVDDTAAVGVPG